MAMGTAATIGAINRSRCAAGLGPCLFRGAGFDQKRTLVVHAIVLLSHPLNHSVSDINCIKRHIDFISLGEPCFAFTHHGALVLMLRWLAGNYRLLEMPTRHLKSQVDFWKSPDCLTSMVGNL